MDNVPFFIARDFFTWSVIFVLAVPVKARTGVPLNIKSHPFNPHALLLYKNNNNITKFYPLGEKNFLWINKILKNSPVILLALLRCVLYKNKMLRVHCL